MTNQELMIILIFAPFAAIIGGFLGRKFQRFWWNLDLPYEERVMIIRRCREAA